MGLTARRKYIPSKYFYDARGSRLFEAICHLPEYYPTRLELRLLRTHARELLDGFREGDLVELGSGANWKIRMLLHALGPSRRAVVRYVPVDVSHAALTASAQELAETYPELKISAIVSDFMRDLHRLESDRPKIVLFFGSTIGNLDERESSAFLKCIAKILNPGDRFILGLDMVKAEEILEAAYNDSRHITAEFNKNILLVLNREVGADFDTDDFDHVTFFNRERAQIEMHLRTRRDVRVAIRRLEFTVSLRKGETIRTEICRKFSQASVQEMVSRSGLRVTRWFSDPDGWFSLAEIMRPNEFSFASGCRMIKR
jgi:L-histidine Nalpha-methyltransferase